MGGDKLSNLLFPVDIFNFSSGIKHANCIDALLNVSEIIPPLENIMKCGASPLNFVNRWEPNADVGDPRSDPYTSKLYTFRYHLPCSKQRNRIWVWQRWICWRRTFQLQPPISQCWRWLIDAGFNINTSPKYDAACSVHMCHTCKSSPSVIYIWVMHAFP